MLADVGWWIADGGRTHGGLSPTGQDAGSVQRPWMHVARWIMPAIASIVLVASYTSEMLHDVRRASVIRFDGMDRLIGADSSGVPVFVFEGNYEQADSGFGLLPNPDVVLSEVSIARDATCVMEGRMSLSNWRTSVRIGLGGLDESERSGGSQTIWSWNSAEAQFVYFRRTFTNGLRTAQARPKLYIWNDGLRPVRLEAETYMRCDGG